MERQIIAITMSIMIPVFLSAQKKPLDYEAITNWPEIRNEKISNDGKYVIYNLKLTKDNSKLVAQETNNSWKNDIKNCRDAIITEDSKKLIFVNKNDSLCIVVLGADGIKFMDKVSSYKLSHEKEEQWLAYTLKDHKGDLVLNGLTGEKQIKYANVESYEFSQNGEVLMLIQKSDSNGATGESISLVNLATVNSHLIWRGNNAKNCVVDNSGSQVCFQTKTIIREKKVDAIWYFKNGMDSAKSLIDESKAGMDGMQISNRGMFFSKDGENLFFYIHDLKKECSSRALDSSTRVVVWSYKNDELTSNFAFQNSSGDFAAVLNLQLQHRVIRLELKKGDYLSQTENMYNGNEVLIWTNMLGELTEYNWRRSARPKLFLVSTQSGNRTLMQEDLISPLPNTVGFSPGGKYVYWFDRIKGQWFCYSREKKQIKNISSTIPVVLTNNFEGSSDYSPAEGLVGWLKSDTGLLIYDNYDIWRVDPKGLRDPANITQGYGKKNKIRLRLLDFSDNDPEVFDQNDTLVLFGFNINTKENGLFKLSLSKSGKLMKLVMRGMLIYYDFGRFAPGFASDAYNGQFVLKAKNTRIYLFKPSSENQFPNLSVTHDLIHFVSLTNFTPQCQYNWYSTELIKWTLPDGKMNEGILYKPEDFSPRIRYPLIIYIYESFSDALHLFLRPTLSRGTLDIPWYTSHGYLVLAPDIHCKVGYPGQSALNSVVSAVRFLSKKAWVDRKKIGLQGHSYGGFETNYIVSKTGIFAAAAPASGLTDLISESGQLQGSTGYQFMFEIRQMRIGATLWQNPNSYFENSAILRADKVNTPLLIMHNPNDEAVHFSQATEWFTALRRLGKKAWLIQYPEESHSIWNEQNQLDFSIRMNQFFDHFLKGAPAPRWMSGE